MKKSILFGIIFLFSGFIFVICLSNSFFSFYYTTEVGDGYYNSKVTENVLVFNYGKNIKYIGYCFTSEDKCENYVSYDGDLSKRILNVSIDYPDSDVGERICVNIVSDLDNSTSCSDEVYIVDSLAPSVKPLYDTIIVSKDNVGLEDFYEIHSQSGIKDFNCDYTDREGDKVTSIKCVVVGNNNLKTEFEQKVYLENNNNLEGKKILFVGDSITEANSSLDNFKGWSGRVGLGNYMDWYNAGVGGATIAYSNRHITNQLHDNKDEYYDYIILQGGINDMDREVSLGEMTDSFEVDDFDNSTYAGGLEELFYYAKKYNPNAKIGFIITYQTPNSDWGDAVTDRSEWAELTRNICDKWEIPYLDLYDGVVFADGEAKTYSEILKVNTGEHFHNQNPIQVHLGSTGYDVVSKYISIWIKTL